MGPLGFGIYIHIPYCLQKCLYCDFVTIDLQRRSSTPPPDEYVSCLLTELDLRAEDIRSALSSELPLTSIYFGGGTPSLLAAKDILAVLNKIATLGFSRAPNCEITIEINPGTIDAEKLDLYLASGVNRFSVGAQTFRDDFLRACGREHTSQMTRETLRLLSGRNLNFSFDLLFGLPHQNLNDLSDDLSELIAFSPPHVSLYNLTVPQNHPMNRGRATDEVQSQMFEVIETELQAVGLRRYEISNFSKTGFESRHNCLYWQGLPYWGVGIAAHSFLPEVGPFGSRFSNPSSTKVWMNQISGASLLQDESPLRFWENLPKAQVERLFLHEALTDFFHTHLRQTRGFSWQEFRTTLQSFQVENTYIQKIICLAQTRADELKRTKLIVANDGRIRLTPTGYVLANAVFLKFTFLPDELRF